MSNKTVFPLAVVWLVLCLAGCGAGGGGAAFASASGSGGGIGGTGLTSSGTIDGFGSVFVNGVELGSHTDSTFAAGDIGLFATKYEEEGSVHIRFDDLRVDEVR